MNFKQISLAVALLACTLVARTQQIVLTAGGNATGGGGSSSYSIGQVNYLNFSSYDASVSLGVQQPSALAVGSLSFSGKVYLEGAYDETSGNMSTILNTSGILQANALLNPYNNNAFDHVGSEYVLSGFFASHINIVDWVLIELRDAVIPSTVVAKRAAFVKQDGTLVETNGIATQIAFPAVAPGNYYVVIRHRNHLGIRSSSPINFSLGTGNYDFTNGGSKSYRNQSYTSTVQKGSIWVMRGGNAHADDTQVKYNGPFNDQNQIQNSKLGGSFSLVLNNQYAREDLNLDGKVKTNGPDNDQNFLLNIILGGSISIVFIEQL